MAVLQETGRITEEEGIRRGVPVGQKNLPPPPYMEFNSDTSVFALLPILNSGCEVSGRGREDPRGSDWQAGFVNV